MEPGELLYTRLGVIIPHPVAIGTRAKSYGVKVGRTAERSVYRYSPGGQRSIGGVSMKREIHAPS